MFLPQRREDGEKAEGPPLPAAVCLREKRRVCVYVNKYLHDAQSSGCDSCCLCAARVRGRALRSVMVAFVDVAALRRGNATQRNTRTRRRWDVGFADRVRRLCIRRAVACAFAREINLCSCVCTVARVCVCARVCMSIYVCSPAAD